LPVDFARVEDVTFEQDAPFRRFLQTDCDAPQGAFATATLTDEGKAFTLLDVQCDTPDCPHFALV
jgi:hypothetical protein